MFYKGKHNPTFCRIRLKKRERQTLGTGVDEPFSFVETLGTGVDEQFTFVERLETGVDEYSWFQKRILYRGR